MTSKNKNKSKGSKKTKSIYKSNLGKDNIVKLEWGGNLTDAQSGGIGMGLNMLGDTSGLIQDKPMLSGALGGAGKGAAAGMSIGGPVGALIGGGLGAVTGLIKGNQEKKAEEEARLAKEEALSKTRITSDVNRSNSINQMYRDGGDLNNNITQYEGNSHENGGIPLGNTGKEVENNETRGIKSTKDYVFSDKLKKGDKSFAQHSKDIEKKYANVGNDKLAIDAKDVDLKRLMYEQEDLKLKAFERRQAKLQKDFPDLYNQQSQQPQQLQPLGNMQDTQMNSDMNQQEPQQLKFGGLTNPDGTPWYVNEAKIAPEGFNSEGYNTDNIDNKNYFYKSTTNPYTSVVPGKSNNLGTYSDEQALAIMQNEYKTGKTVRRGWNSNVHKNFDNWLTTQNSNREAYYQDPNTTTITTTPPNNIPGKSPGIDTGISTVTSVPDITQYNGGSDGTFEATEPGPRSSFKSNPWLTVGSAVPNMIGAVGNWMLSRDVNYDRVNPKIAQADYVDPTRAIQESRDQYAGAKDLIRQNARGAGNYMSNLIGATASQSKANANINSQYDNINAGIFNQLDQYNTTNRQQAEMTNAQIAMQEVQDRLGFKQQAIEHGSAAVGDMFQTALKQKRDNDMLEIMGNGDQIYAQVDGKPVTAWWDNGRLKYQGVNGIEDVPDQKVIRSTSGNRSNGNSIINTNSSNLTSNSNNQNNSNSTNTITTPSNISSIANKSKNDITDSDLKELGTYIDELTLKSKEFGRNKIASKELDDLRLKYNKLSKGKSDINNSKNSTSNITNTSNMNNSNYSKMSVSDIKSELNNLPKESNLESPDIMNKRIALKEALRLKQLENSKSKSKSKSPYSNYKKIDKLSELTF